MSANDRESPDLNLIGERVALGPLYPDLLPHYLQWVNDFEIMRTFGTPVSVSESHAANWYESSVHSQSAQRFVIYERRSLEPIGYTGLVDIDHRNQRAELEIMIGDRTAQGKGYGTEAVQLTLEYAFVWLGLHNVMLEVSSSNQAGLAVYRKAGFREIGRRREAFKMDSAWYDKVFMDILSSEFTGSDSSKIQSSEETSSRQNS